MSRHCNWIIAVMLVLLTFGAFCRAIVCDFTNYDDPAYVLKNPHVQAGLSWRGITWAFTTLHLSFWHPLVWISYMVDRDLYGTGPFGFHLTNIVIHALSTLLLFFAMLRLTRSLWRSALVASLFGVHPSRVESVVWIAERKDVLSAFFWVLTMLAYSWYVELPNTRRYFAVLAAFTLGLMAKPMLVTLPFVLLLMDYWPLRRLQSGKIGMLCLEKVPFLFIALFFSGLAYYAQAKGGAVSSLGRLGLGARAANSLISYVKYMWQMLWPRNLAVIYPHPGSEVSPVSALGAFLILIVISVFVIKWCKDRPYVLFGWLWYLGTLVPVIGIVQFGSHAMADRFTYIPFIGMFVAIAWGIPDVICLSRPRSCAILGAAGCCTLMALGTCTFIQTGYWKDSVRLFSRALAVTERNYVAHLNLATALADRKQYGQAVRHYNAAIEIYPDQANAHFNLANALFLMGDVRGAIEHYQETLRLDPSFPDAAANLEAANACLMGRRKGSAPVLRSPQRDAAVRHFREGVRLESSGDMSGAVSEYREAIRLDPGFAEAHCNLGVILKDQGKLDDAIKEYRKALEIRSDFAEAHGNLAVALYFKGRYAEAWKEVELCRKYGVEPHPDFIKALSEKMPEPAAEK